MKRRNRAAANSDVDLHVLVEDIDRILEETGSTGVQVFTGRVDKSMGVAFKVRIVWTDIEELGLGSHYYQRNIFFDDVKNRPWKDLLNRMIFEANKKLEIIKGKKGRRDNGDID